MKKKQIKKKQERKKERSLLTLSNRMKEVFFPKIKYECNADNKIFFYCNAR